MILKLLRPSSGDNDRGRTALIWEVYMLNSLSAQQNQLCHLMSQRWYRWSARQMQDWLVNTIRLVYCAITILCINFRIAYTYVLGTG